MSTLAHLGSYSRTQGVGRVGFFGMAAQETYTSYLVSLTDPGGMATTFLATPLVTQVRGARQVT